MLKTFTVALLSGLLGAVVGVALYVVAFEQSETPRGTTVVLNNPARFPDLATTPFCVSAQKLCIVRLDSGELRALYTYDTHSPSRQRNCEIEWLPDFTFRDPANDQDVAGWFRSGCSGTTFRYTGEYVFGPGARDMDRFSVELRDDVVETPDGDELPIASLHIDTRSLICGTVANPTVPDDCDKAPLPQ